MRSLRSSARKRANFITASVRETQLRMISTGEIRNTSSANPLATNNFSSIAGVSERELSSLHLHSMASETESVTGARVRSRFLITRGVRELHREIIVAELDAHRSEMTSPQLWRRMCTREATRKTLSWPADAVLPALCANNSRLHLID